MERLCQDRNNPVKIAIVGGGPAGIYCALNILKLFEEADFKDYSLTIFDKSQILRTILPTGNGRCNITNDIRDVKEFASNYPRGEKFLYSVFSRYFTPQTLDFFSSCGIETYVQPDGRIFPKSNSAKEVKQKLLNKLYSYKNVKPVNRRIVSLDELIGYDRIIIATGSKSGDELIKSTGHKLIPFKKSLCELYIKDNIYPKGVSVKCPDGEFIFTENGISGPLAFKISSLNSRYNFPYDISIKLFSVDEVKKVIKINTKKSIGNIISGFIPRSFAHTILDDFNKKASEISNKMIEELSNLKLTVISAGLSGEIVNSGGVDLAELDKNFKSKLVKNLWFCGEVVDIDGFCGGFNLQNCWSGGYIVAFDVVNSIIKI